MGLITGALSLPYNQKIVDDLTFQNPFESDKDFKAYFKNKGDIIIPRAYPIDTLGFKVLLVSAKCDFELATNYKLKDYQEVAISEILDYFSGKIYGQLLLSAPTGSGKSFAMAGLISELRQRTLIVSHLTMLGTQILSEIVSNLTEVNIGILDTKSAELPDIAIVSFQLLDSNPVLLKLCSDHYGLVIVDESENAFTRSRLKVLFSLKPRYQVYLTATPSRELSKQTKGLFYLFGDKVVHMDPPEEQKVHSKHLFVDYRPLQWQSPQNKNMYKTSLGKFIMRSSIPMDIARLCKNLKSKDVEGTIWIIIDLNVAQDKLEELLVGLGLTVGIIRGTTSQKKRNQILEAIAKGELDVIIGAAPLSAGLSIPELSIGIRLLPNSSSDELLFQMRGRLNRFKQFKLTQSPLWLDFIISGSLEFGAKKRHALYKQTTYGVKVCKPDDLTETILKEIYENI